MLALQGQLLCCADEVLVVELHQPGVRIVVIVLVQVLHCLLDELLSLLLTHPSVSTQSDAQVALRIDGTRVVHPSRTLEGLDRQVMVLDCFLL